MKKNWIIFFLICGVAYAWMFHKQFERQKAYDAAEKQYQIDLKAYNDAQALKQQEREEARRAMEEVKAAAATTTAETAATTTGESPEGEAAIPVLSEQRELYKKLATVETSRRIPVETDLYNVVFTELGARPIDWEIKTSQYVRNIAESGKSAETISVRLIPQVGDADERAYPLEFVGYTARDFNGALFHEDIKKFEGGTRVTFTSDPVNDMIATKEFIFRNDSYVVDLKVGFKNASETRRQLGRGQGFGIGWQGGLEDPEPTDRVHGVLNVVIGVDDTVRTRSLKRTDEPYTLASSAAPINWIGLEKKFFAALIVPGEQNPIESITAQFEGRNDDPAYQVKGASLPISVTLLHAARELEPNQSVSLSYQLYAGPKNREALGSQAFNLVEGSVKPERLVFHTVPLGLSKLRSLCLLLLSLMKWLNEHLGAWGLAIICTTLIVRTVIYPLTHWAIKNQARTMIEQQKIRPEMEALQKKFKSDPMKRNQAIMQLYRDHNVNPLGFLRGCFPILLQMPVFLALYVVFEQSVELRGQSFLWIPDLSGPDRLIEWGANLPLIGRSFNILPIIMGVTNFIQMKIMQMPATDETQAQIQKQMMYMMPIVFTFFLYHLPSGLILYWTVSNVMSIGQSYLTKRIIASHMAEHEAKKAAGGQSADDKKDTDDKKQRVIART